MLLTYQISIGENVSIVFVHFLSSIFIFRRTYESTKTIKDISDILNFAIAIASQNTSTAGIAAISAQTKGANDLKIEYQIPPPIITIVSCLKLNHKKIGSSFSICTGILYCIN
jgi:hypothetical protein